MIKSKIKKPGGLVKTDIKFCVAIHRVTLALILDNFLVSLYMHSY